MPHGRVRDRQQHHVQGRHGPPRTRLQSRGALSRAVMVLRPFAAGRLSLTGYTSSPAREKMSRLAASIARSVASTVRGSWPSTRRMVGSTCGARAALGAAPGVAPVPGPAACDAAAAAVAPPDDPVPAVPGVPPAAAAGASALTGALPPTALPYERVTSLRRRFLAYLAPMPFGYFSNRATMSSIVQCRRLSWSTTDWNSAERLLSLVLPTPPSRMLLASSSGSVASASTGAMVVLAAGAPLAGAAMVV